MNKTEWSSIQKQIGLRIRKWRMLQHLTQAELARRANMPSSGIARLELGQGVGLQRLYAVAEALDVPIYILIK